MVKKLDEISNNFKIVEVHDRQHVISFILVHAERKGRYPEPNYKGTTGALVGILKKSQTLADFKMKWLSRIILQN